MNEQLQQALSAIIKAATDATQFMVGQLPDIIQQLLMWKFVEALFDATVFLSIVGASVYAIYRVWKWALEEDDSDASFVGVVCTAVVGIVFLSPSLIFGISKLETAIQIKIAPKVYLIEYVADKVKK